MKSAQLLLAAALIAGTEAGSQAPQCKTATASGDPHYRPFSGRQNRFTLQNSGEFLLTGKADDSFAVHTCSADTSTRDAEKKQSRPLAWVKHVGIKFGAKTIKVKGDGQIEVDGVSIGDFMLAASINQDFGYAAGDGFKITVRANKKTVVYKDTKGKQVVMNYKAKTATPARSQFGDRTMFNVVVKVCQSECISSMSQGLFAGNGKQLAQANGNWQMTTDRMFTEAECEGSDTTTAPDVTATTVAPAIENCDDTLTATEWDKLKAQSLLACVDADDADGCQFDILEGCELLDIAADNNEVADEVVEFNCPAYSTPSSTAQFPLTEFSDCDSNWGFETGAGAAAETCVPKVTVPAAVTTDEACFCPSNHPYHCMHKGDRSCGLPVLASNTSQTCSDPAMAMTDACVCESTGTTDCRGAGYELVIQEQPAACVPDSAFGVQPKIALVDRNGNVVTGEGAGGVGGAMVKISVGSVQPKASSCYGETPCKHDNDDTCFGKQDLFGIQTCPAGTTECDLLESGANVKLFRSDDHKEDDLRCQGKNIFNQEVQDSAGIGFCSGEVPCKHQGDGHCMQKATYNLDAAPAAAVLATPKCAAQDSWKHAEPNPQQGWHFTTDDTSTAMDKWCDHNCNPRYPGQPPYCPPSHCICEDATAAAPKQVQATDWKCPLSRYNDGSCLCSAGTTECGSITVPFVDGVASFSALTIGVAGRYQLKAEVVMPDINTGSNRMQLSTSTTMFQCSKAQETTGCRAHDFWRKPNMREKSDGWFFEDSVACTKRNADGTCETSHVEYAMDKWCKANRCLPHTLTMVGAQSACVVGTTPQEVVTGDVVDSFGQVCATRSSMAAACATATAAVACWPRPSSPRSRARSSRSSSTRRSTAAPSMPRASTSTTTPASRRRTASTASTSTPTRITPLAPRTTTSSTATGTWRVSGSSTS